MDKELRELVEKSGHNLHLRIATKLREEGWDVDIAPYYVDDVSDKPREIDIRATKTYTYRGLDDEATISFKIFLFIECKYFKKPFAIRTAPKTEGAESAIIAVGMNRANATQWSFDRHHYKRTIKIAKLFDSPESNTIYDALTSVAKSLIFYKEVNNVRGIYFPIVIYDGIDGMFEIDGTDSEAFDNAKLVENTLMGFNYSYRSVKDREAKTQPLIVDFTHYKNFDRLLQVIYNDAEILKNLFT